MSARGWRTWERKQPITINEYAYFAGRKVALLPASGAAQYYAADMLGSSRVMVNSATGAPCYDADFTPFGSEVTYASSCPVANSYKFEGKERDTETQNDEFGARYYSWRYGRWLSADWSSVPAPVPYANLSNPQTLNLYAMVSDDPESFADLDGHIIVMGGPGPGSGSSGFNPEGVGMEDSLLTTAIWESNPSNTGTSATPPAPSLQDNQGGAKAQQQSQPDAKTAKINSRAQSQYNNDVPIIAKQLGVSTDEVLNSVHIAYDDNGRAVVIGGHVNMNVDDGSDAQTALAAKLGPGPHGYNEDAATGQGQGSEFSRLGTTPSVHLDNGLIRPRALSSAAIPPEEESCRCCRWVHSI